MATILTSASPTSLSDTAHFPVNGDQKGWAFCDMFKSAIDQIDVVRLALPPLKQEQEMK
jgi:hypothetical protein